VTFRDPPEATEGLWSVGSLPSSVKWIAAPGVALVTVTCLAVV